MAEKLPLKGVFSGSTVTGLAEFRSADNDVVGVGVSDFTYGLGFNWGGMTADFTVASALLQDPVGTITGYGDGGLTDGTITLTYSF